MTSLIYHLLGICFLFGVLYVINLFIKSTWIKKTVTIPNLIGGVIAYSCMFYFGSLYGNKKTTFVDTLWSKHYTDSVYKLVYAGIGKNLADTQGHRLMAECVVYKIKAKYPKGINSLGQDAINSVWKESVKDCMKNIVLHLNWSAQADSSIKEGIRKSLTSYGNIPAKAIPPMCDCYVKQLRKLYPNGPILPIAETIKDSLVLYCAHHIESY